MKVNGVPLYLLYLTSKSETKTGHFLLTKLLLDKMKQTAKTTGIEGRIVNLSSIAHLHTYSGGIRFNNINDKSGFVSLICNLLFEKIIMNNTIFRLFLYNNTNF